MEKIGKELAIYFQFVNNVNKILEPEVVADDGQGVDEDEGNFDSDGSLYLDSSYYTEDEDEDDFFIDNFLYEMAATAA